MRCCHDHHRETTHFDQPRLCRAGPHVRSSPDRLSSGATENALAGAGFGSQAQFVSSWTESVFETAPFNRSATSPCVFLMAYVQTVQLLTPAGDDVARSRERKETARSGQPSGLPDCSIRPLSHPSSGDCTLVLNWMLPWRDDLPSSSSLCRYPRLRRVRHLVRRTSWPSTCRPTPTRSASASP